MEMISPPTFATSCIHCNKPMLIPLKHDWAHPLYVFHMVDEHKALRKMLTHAHDEMLELAQECVEAGVRPSVLKRADETMKLFRELKKRMGME